MAAAAALVLTLALGACGGGDTKGDDAAPGNAGDGPTSTAAATVTLEPTTFEPADVTIKAGESVRWKWGGGVQHDVAGEGFKSKIQSKGKYEHTFDTAGTFEYKCEVHPTTMKGTVTVQ